MDHRDVIIVILGVTLGAMWWFSCVLTYNCGWCDGASKFIEDMREGNEES